ncbi:MAG: GNAT family N-acetyltransferase, partial [Propionibacteriaceae bacterium]
MHIRVGRSEDLAPLTALYNHYIATTVATFDLEPFTLDQREELWFRHYAPTGRYRLLVAEEDGVILGYATSSPFRAKAAYDTSVETSIYL